MNGSEAPCPFCEPDPARVVDSDAHTLTLRDAFAVSPRHTLVVVRRHVGSAFELTAAEWEAVRCAIARARAVIDAELHPDGYNIGINVGSAAGQTIDHVHVHLIPRYLGDVPDPVGGVRGVIPGRANYRRQPP